MFAPETALTQLLRELIANTEAAIQQHLRPVRAELSDMQDRLAALEQTRDRLLGPSHRRLDERHLHHALVQVASTPGGLRPSLRRRGRV